MGRIQSGMDVYGSDGEKVGDVSDVTGSYVLVTKGFLFTKDIYIPTSAITGVEGDRVYISVSKDRVDSMGWDAAPAGGAGYGTASTGTAGTGAMGGGMVSPQELGGSAATGGDDYVVAQRVESAGTQPATTGTAGMTGAASVSDEDTLRVRRYEEELEAQKVEREAGRVRVTKDVVEEQRTLEVPVTREEVHVRSRQVDQPTGAVGADAFREGTIEVPIREEEVVLSKEVRVAEELEIEKRAVQETERVSGTVRREQVNIEQVGDVDVTGGTDTTTGGTTRR